MMAQSLSESTLEIIMEDIYISIPTEYYKINTAIWKDQQENI